MSKTPLHFKLALIFFIFAAGISGITAAVYYRAASRQVMQDIRHRLLDLVATIPKGLDADLHDQLQDPSQEGLPEYLAFRTALQRIRDASSDIFFIYTMRAGPQGKICFVVDAESDPSQVAHLGEVYDDPSPLLAKNFATLSQPMVEAQFYTDEWGTWLSGYAPIFRDDGTRAGVLGVDIAAHTVAEYKKETLLLVAGVFALNLPLILLAGFVVGRWIARPIIRMKDSAERMGQGELDLDLGIERHDEIGLLAAALEHMAQRIKSTQDQLTDMAEDYRAVFENAVEGIFQSRFDGRILRMNRALLNLLNYRSLEEIQERVKDLRQGLFARPEDRDVMLDTLEQRGEIRGFQVRMLRADGEQIWVELSAHVLTDRHGQPIIEGMVQDISERLRREQAEKDRRAAEAASQAKSEFLANMSHEIRTPLNAVMGLADLLARTELKDKQRDYLRKIKVSSQTLLAVINDILDFSKIEAGRLELEQADFNLLNVMADLTEMFGPRAHEKEIELLVSVADDVPAALIGDQVRLGQILINLTNNAIKFTDQGEVVVSVTCLEQDEEMARLEFSVSDTGVGIHPDRLDAIFDSFTQEDSSTTRQHGGTGLGLTICRQLTRLMGGEIHAESTPGQGSRFRFTVPLKCQPPERQTLHTTPVDLRGLNVLVVDDNQTAREILTQTIASFQMNAQAAASGTEAIAMIHAASPPFDLILMDWRMPGISGVETAQKIKQELAMGKVPIICMISAYGREDLMKQAERSLVDAFLHKPVNQSLLFDTIMGLFGRHEYRISKPADEPEDPLQGLDAERVSGARLLLVEDNPINREVALEWLHSAGAHVVTAENGRRAIDLLESIPPDSEDAPIQAVLMDIQMPEMDGLEATRRLRQTDRFKALPIIAMTAHALKGDRERCLAVGMNDYITKPIDPRRLFATLASWLPTSDRAHPVRQPQIHDASLTPNIEGLDLPGIDVQDGLYRANRNARLYLRLLHTLLNDFKDSPDTLVHLAREGQFGEARRLSHSIKGVTANLGAQSLSEAAAELEISLSQEILPEVDSPLWTRFNDRIHEVMTGLRQNLPPLQETSRHPPGAEHWDTESICQKLREIADTLDDDLDTARDALEQRVPHLRSLIGDKPVDELVTLIDEFDFDAASQKLHDFANTIQREDDHA